MKVAADEALTTFCQAEHPRLFAAMTVYTGDRDLAAELAQESLARACRDWRLVRDMASPGAWTYRVARNLANSHFRRRRLERAATGRAEFRNQKRTGEHAPSNDTGVLTAVSGLPRRQREAVTLRFLMDLTVEDSASRMGCAPGTVRALTHQGVAALRALPQFSSIQEPGHV